MGRKQAINLACAIFIAGAAGMILSQNYGQLLVGRLLTGLGVGCGFVVAPVYITEITPPHIRGKLVALTDIMINMGILLGGPGAVPCLCWCVSPRVREYRFSGGDPVALLMGRYFGRAPQTGTGHIL